MLKLLRRWLGWDSGSGLFDFGELDLPPRTRVPPAAAKAPATTAKSAAPAGKTPAAGRKPSTAAMKPPAAAAKPSAAAPRPPVHPQQRKPVPAKPPAEQKDEILDILDNPKLTLDRPMSGEDGFDPYNTGAFNRSQNWERISRKR